MENKNKTTKTVELTQEQKVLLQVFLTPFHSKEQLKDWIALFLNLDLPDNHIDPTSNSSPIEWLYDAYCVVRDNKGNTTPSIVVYAARESYKTLTVAIFEVICMVHFGWTVAHMAAIEPQSKKAASYVVSFIQKINEYLLRFGRNVASQNTRNISIVDDKGNKAYITIIICTMQGANSEHTNLFVVDEVDVVRFPKAYEESKMIPGEQNGIAPLTIMTSTRKFSFGLMQKEIEAANELGRPVLHWNILDITRKCEPDRFKPEEPRVIRYVSNGLPLANLNEAEHELLSKDEKEKFSRVEAFSGCSGCKLLSVCRTRLATRSDTGNSPMYKTIDFTINQFLKISPEMGEAQLLCWKPSSTGLIYSRYDDSDINGNKLTLRSAWLKLTGIDDKDIGLDDLVDYMHQKGFQFHAGVDWGFRHYGVVMVGVLVNGEWWIVDCHAVSGYEFDQFLELAKHVRDQYKVRKWFADQAEPMFIKTFRKNRMPCPDFTKDVQGGIESVRGQVCDAQGKRRLKLLWHTRNEMVDKMFKSHHFILDAAGNPTREPDDEEYADIGDALRYIGQNLFKPKKSTDKSTTSKPEIPLNMQDLTKFPDWIQLKVNELTNGQVGGVVKSKSGGIIADFGESE